jgi:hypothetical protein
MSESENEESESEENESEEHSLENNLPIPVGKIEPSEAVPTDAAVALM